MCKYHLYDKLDKDGHTVIYDPDEYSGVRLVSRVNNQKVSFMIFHSGNVIGSGFKNKESIHEHLSFLYNFIEGFKSVFSISA